MLVRGALSARTALGMNFEERTHGLLRASARHAAFGSDAEFRSMAARRGNARPGPLGPIFSVDDAQEQRGARGQIEIAKRAMKGVIAAIHRHGHMNVGEPV